MRPPHTREEAERSEQKGITAAHADEEAHGGQRKEDGAQHTEGGGGHRSLEVLGMAGHEPLVREPGSGSLQGDEKSQTGRVLVRRARASIAYPTFAR